MMACQEYRELCSEHSALVETMFTSGLSNEDSGRLESVRARLDAIEERDWGVAREGKPQ